MRLPRRFSFQGGAHHLRSFTFLKRLTNFSLMDGTIGYDVPCIWRNGPAGVWWITYFENQEQRVRPLYTETKRPRDARCIVRRPSQTAIGNLNALALR